jgi:hypothetical protein
MTIIFQQPKLGRYLNFQMLYFFTFSLFTFFAFHVTDCGKRKIVFDTIATIR